MLDFIFRLNEVLPGFQAGSRLTLTHISSMTETSIPHVLQIMTDALGKEFDITEDITLEEAYEALDHLKKKNKAQIDHAEKQRLKRQKKAIELHEKILVKVRILQINGNWHNSFRTLCYFAGQFQEDLPVEIMINLCSDIVRVGIKANANIQEIALWMQHGVKCAMGLRTRPGMVDALDLVDAYGKYFLDEPTGKGSRILGNILISLEEPAARYELWEEYKELINNLYPITDD